jgi:hypothetical protein
MNIEIFQENLHVRRAVLGFSGWPDAGQTINHTLAHMQENLPCEVAAVWDMEGFWHTGSMRPQVHVIQGHIQELDWPEWRFSVCTPPTSQPVLVGIGPEPECHWRLFTSQLLQMLNKWGCREIFLLGSLLDQVFHDEVTISCVAQDTLGFNRARELGCQMADYMGSAAIHSSIMQAALPMDMHVLSLWARLPFYLEGPHELTMATLMDILGTLLDFQVDTLPLLETWREREKEIESNIHQDQDLHQILESMKKQDRTSKPSSPTSNVVRLDEFLQKKHRPPPEED